MKLLRMALLAGGLCTAFCLVNEVGSAAFGLAAAGAAPGRRPVQIPPGENNERLQREQLRHFLGMTVENADGLVLGTVKNFLVNLSTGQVPYALVGNGGFLGLGGRVRIVPVERLSNATTKKNTLELNVTLGHWQKAPRFKARSLATLARPGAHRQIERFYAHAALPVGTLLESATAADPQALSPVGGTSPPGSEENGSNTGQKLQLATELIGQPVTDRQQQNLGKVADLLIDLAGQKPPFAIVTTGGLFHRGQALAIPLSLCQAKPPGALQVRADPQDLVQAPLFGQAIWQASAHSPVGKVYRYPDADAIQASRKPQRRSQAERLPWRLSAGRLPGQPS